MSVYVVLSRSSTVLSRTIRIATGDDYTHAALALDPTLDLMFSFGRRRARNPFVGCFKRERLDDDVYRSMDTLPGLVLEVPATDGQRDAVGAEIGRFLLDGHTYSYNTPGLLRGLVGRGTEDGNRYFCSEFVYHVLRHAGVCDLGVPRWEVRPQTLRDVPGAVLFEGDLKQYAPERPDGGAGARAVDAALTVDRTGVRIAA
ncbi:hypothetical protein ATJ88_1976 [Isoptericola jiangsuensis]|uniref:Permuted papain-like amidase YaeF/Yiix C92 family enzyme n=1 Tax=Isoptericola jiangsuensis TaxID=548579 RepID=A0A2A9EXR0_9MICO|nr:hypothetical protein [Isoptericola jiangsuensis]PFG43291.1 hypothetical protein ATJ88_1976 [Isoptericola jiangsuensis]